MEFRRSITGIPYILLDDKNRLAFGLKKGNKYRGLVFTGLEVTPFIKADSSKKGQKKVHAVKERLSFITDFKLSDVKRKYKKACPILNNGTIGNLKEIFKPFLDNNGHISEVDIGSIEEKVARLEI